MGKHDGERTSRPQSQDCPSDKLALSYATAATHNEVMDRTSSPSGWRASAFAVALFAITLNFLQPLAHAAMMRDGAPSTLWDMFCNSAAAGADADKNSKPVAVDAHECCLGLAHAAAFTTPSTVFVTLAPIVTTVAPLIAKVRSTPVGIRDGPTRPRGPPSFV
jgi:hypothetical protein